MNTRWRSMAVVVLLFTALAVAMVWGLSLRLQGQLREQMLEQAQARALQLADAMGGRRRPSPGWPTAPCWTCASSGSARRRPLCRRWTRRWPCCRRAWCRK